MDGGYEDKGLSGADTKRFKKVGHKMSDPILDSLKTYWENLRAGRVAPYRSEIDPREFKHALENMFILEIVGDKNIRVRLAGMKMCEMMGMEVRGMSPRAFMMPGDRSKFDDAILDVVAKPTVTEFVMETVDYNGRSGTAYVLMMPLRSDFGEITRILGCITDAGDAYEAPVRMRITRMKSDQIKFDEAADEAKIAGFAERQPRFSDKTERPALSSITGGATRAPNPQKKNRSHLRVVDKD